MDFDGPWHGNEGRIPVRRIFPDLWPEHAKAAGETFKAAGYKFLVDQNAEFEDGYFPITISNAYERRVSAAIGYLDPGTRMRENLTISTDTQVSALLFDGLRCVGVKALVGGRETEFRGTRGDPVVRRNPFAGASVARRHRPGGASARHGHRGARRTCPASGSGCRIIRRSRSPPSSSRTRGSSTTIRDGTSIWRCAIRRSWTAFRRATCSPWSPTRRRGTRWASRSARSSSRCTRRIPRPAR